MCKYWWCVEVDLCTSYAFHGLRIWTHSCFVLLFKIPLTSTAQCWERFWVGMTKVLTTSWIPMLNWQLRGHSLWSWCPLYSILYTPPAAPTAHLSYSAFLVTLSLVPRPFWSKRGEEGCGDSGQDVVTQWNTIMGILCNYFLAMRWLYPNCCRDCALLQYGIDLLRISLPL